MEIHFDLVQSSVLALILLALGEWARHRVGFLRRFCFPAPVIGGFLFALIVLALRQTGTAEIDFDTSLQSPAMVAFFTTIGLAGSLATIKKGGRLLLLYLVACWTLAIMQNLIGIGIGIGMASAMGIDPMLGIMAGTVSLEGGHGAAAAFGPTAESMGVEGATAVAIASATFGLVAGSLLGGMTASFLVARHKVEIPAMQGVKGAFATVGSVAKHMVAGDGSAAEQPGAGGAVELPRRSGTNPTSLLTVAVVIGVIMIVGMALGDWISGLTGFSLPDYVGAMIIAVVFRNLNDRFNWVAIDDDTVELVSHFTLGFFLTLAMMSLKIWELASLAGPLVIILLVQLAFILAFAVFVVFRMLGKNYDAATMISGFIGHGLGATPNALANMDAFSAKFGVRSERAFLIVPLAGAVLIDLVGLPWIVWCMNWVG